MSTVACPSQASVTALSGQLSGLGVFGAGGTPRSVEVTALMAPSVETPPSPAAPIVRNLRRFHIRLLRSGSGRRPRTLKPSLAYVCEGVCCRSGLTQESGLDFGVPQESREGRVEVLDDLLLGVIDLQAVRPGRRNS